MLDNFFAWQERVASACNEQGHWCDAADPRSGYPIAGSWGQRWNEVKAAHALLGYEIVGEEDLCPVLSHPRHGEIYTYHFCGLDPLERICRGEESKAQAIYDVMLCFCSYSNFVDGLTLDKSTVNFLSLPWASTVQGAVFFPAGTSIYPATLLSTAPPPHLLTACHQASCVIQEEELLMVETAESPPDQNAIAGDVYNEDAERSMASNLSSCSTNEGNLPNGCSSTESHLLVLQQFSCSIGNSLAIVTNLDLCLRPGEHLLIAGPSGAGKSTLVQAVAGLWPSTAKSMHVTQKVLLCSLY